MKINYVGISRFDFSDVQTEIDLHRQKYQSAGPMSKTYQCRFKCIVIDAIRAETKHLTKKYETSR